MDCSLDVSCDLPTLDLFCTLVSLGATFLSGECDLLLDFLTDLLGVGALIEIEPNCEVVVVEGCDFAAILALLLTVSIALTTDKWSNFWVSTGDLEVRSLMWFILPGTKRHFVSNSEM